MGSKSKIEWTDSTWNPITGCTKVSPGCLNCYAERYAKRFSKEPFSEVHTHPEKLGQPAAWKKPRKIFVCSMSDIFHEKVDFDFIGDIWDEMICKPRHTFLVLTKRPERMLDFWKWYDYDDAVNNIWIGVTAENQKMADERIPILLKMPAAVKFLSVEPMLEKIDIAQYLWAKDARDYGKDTPGLDWVICGAESGQEARPFEMDWAHYLKSQCLLAGIPFFFKQARIDGNLVKMPELDGKVWRETPEVVNE